MSRASVVLEIPGVSNALIGDTEGHLVEQAGTDADGESTVAVVAVLLRDFGQIGDLLGLGECETVSLRAGRVAQVVARRGGSVLLAQLDPSRASPALEERVRNADWLQPQDDTLSDADIEYEEISAPAPSGEASPGRASGADQSPPAPIVVSDRPPRGGSDWINEAMQVSRAGTYAQLRRALIKGQLSKAEVIAGRLREESRTGDPRVDREEETATQLTLRPLVEGIAAILAGDSHSGLALLKEVGEAAAAGGSLRWAAQIWLARATISAGEGVESAGGYARNARELAESLDSESCAVSLLVSGEIQLLSKEYEQALRSTRGARELFAAVPDEQELASCWLLEARILAAQGKDGESLAAAKRAHHHRPSWPPPVTFIAKRALSEGRVQDAELALQPLIARRSPAAEVERNRRLLQFVRAGAIPAGVAGEYLRLQDAPPSRDCILSLERLSTQFPGVVLLAEALGWKLLRAGEYERASTVFKRLSGRADLSGDERASAMLALGCLAAVESRHANTGVKLRAAVSAAPNHLKTPHPPHPSAAPPLSRIAPAELRDLDGSLPVSLRGELFNEENHTSPRMTRCGPVFAGDLQLFTLPDLLEFLRSGQRTGTLVCSSTEGIGAVHLQSGMITGAASPNSKGIGDYLRVRGAVSLEQLQTIAKDQEEMLSKPLLGSLLVKQGLVSPDVVRAALRDQIRAAITELVGWIHGQFAFDPEAVQEPASAEIQVTVDPQVILLDIFREMDESGRAPT